MYKLTSYLPLALDSQSTFFHTATSRATCTHGATLPCRPLHALFATTLNSAPSSVFHGRTPSSCPPRPLLYPLSAVSQQQPPPSCTSRIRLTLRPLPTTPAPTPSPTSPATAAPHAVASVVPPLSPSAAIGPSPHHRPPPRHRRSPSVIVLWAGAAGWVGCALCSSAGALLLPDAASTAASPVGVPVGRRGASVTLQEKRSSSKHKHGPGKPRLDQPAAAFSLPPHFKRLRRGRPS